MSNETIKNLTSRLQCLNVQYAYAEDTFEEIAQELSRVECRLRTTHTAKRHNIQATRVISRPDNNTNNFMIGDLVRITNKYRTHKEGTKGKVISIGLYYARLKKQSPAPYIKGIGEIWHL